MHRKAGAGAKVVRVGYRKRHRVGPRRLEFVGDQLTQAAPPVSKVPGKAGEAVIRCARLACAGVKGEDRGRGGFKGANGKLGGGGRSGGIEGVAILPVWNAVAIIVRIRIVAQAITVAVQPFVGVEGEGIVGKGSAIAV